MAGGAAAAACASDVTGHSDVTGPTDDTGHTDITGATFVTVVADVATALLRPDDHNQSRFGYHDGVKLAKEVTRRQSLPKRRSLPNDKVCLSAKVYTVGAVV